MKRYLTFIVVFFLFSSILVLNAQKANPESDFKCELETLEIRDGFVSDTVDVVVITEYIGKARNVIIPSSIEGLPVVKLGKSVFQDTNVVSVVIPDSVISIASDSSIAMLGCFKNCKFLQKVILSKNITSIPDKCFLGCEALKTITLHEGITEIGLGAFRESGLESIDFPSSLRRIKLYAFGDTNLKTIKLVGDKYKDIYVGRYAFEECKALTSITLSNVYFVGPYVFKDCKSLRIFNIEGDVSANPGARGQIFSGVHLPLATQKKLKDLGLL